MSTYIKPDVYERTATVVAVVDGDTMHLAADLGCDIVVNMTVRAYGINAPEMHNAPAGPTAKQFAEDWVAAHGPKFVLRTVKDRKEKYGRYLADLAPLDGSPTWCESMLSSGNAVYYLP